VKRAFRSLILGLAWASIWPAYIVILAQAARLGPWPRNLGVLASTALHGMALGAFIPAVLAWLTRRDGWAERFLDVPAPVGRELCRSGRFLAAAAVACLVPAYLLIHGEIAPEGRPITAAGISRLFILVFELCVWGTLFWLLHGGSGLMAWFDLESPGKLGQDPVDPPAASPPLFPAWLLGLSRRRRLLAWAILAVAAGIILLDVRGYRYTSRRLATGGADTLAVAVVCWMIHRGFGRIIVRSCSRWRRPGRSWARALTSAVALRGTSRTRGLEAGRSSAEAGTAAEDPAQAEDLAGLLRQLLFYAVSLAGVLALAWVWELDFALLRFLANQPLWELADKTAVTFGDLGRAIGMITLGIVGWRYMSTLFAVTLFPRIPDDPGVRFAIVTLCRYVVLGISTISALGAIHLGMAQIGVVVAALGVGLGFGLQEIVSNFVCGIILLLERPIRIGDVVTVAGTTGQVDRINIRATTIINGDNQSMIVPNREFITGNLVNWTHKDRILRVSIRVGAAYGSDPDRIVDLLMGIARDDPDVLRTPMPSALLEELGSSALNFVLHAFVPDPGLVGRVKHRLSAEIQRRFGEANVGIPYPTHEVHLCRVPDDLTRVLEQPRWAPGAGATRIDPATHAPPPPHVADPVSAARRYQPAAEPDDAIHRPVDD
jgi:small-conductance mechanosensitive channel